MATDPPTPISRAHPTLSLHLTDSTTFPITSTASSRHTNTSSPSSSPDDSSTINENDTAASLTHLTNTFLTAHENTFRVGFGPALRIGVELKDGTTLSQAYIAPPVSSGVSVPGSAIPGSNTSDGDEVAGLEITGVNGQGRTGVTARDSASALVAGNATTVSATAATEDDTTAPPALVATVVAPGESKGEVRAALVELEGVARRLQEEWVRELAGEDSDEGNTGGRADGGREIGE